MTTRPWLLVSDLDGTLLGHDSSLEEFELWSRNAEEMLVAYATGRNLESVLDCLATKALPCPQFLITNIGTEIWQMPTVTPAFHWPRLRGKSWSPSRIMEHMETIPEAELQPTPFQTAWKLSYFFNDMPEQKLRKLTQNSGNRFLDFLPPQTHKGAAVEALASHLSVSADRIIVAGDSGNDISMFEMGYQNIMVANAQAELRNLAFSRTYRAKSAFAAGVLEGLDFWRAT